MINKNIKTILIPIPNKVYKGGICSYWSAIFDSTKKFADTKFNIVKVGNRGKNILGVPLDQWIFHKACTSEVDLVVLNPSIQSKAFVREALFAKQLIAKDIPFIAFFHGWDIEFEKKVDRYFQKFFLNTYGKAKKIITLSPQAKEKIIDWGYKGEVIIETTIVDSTLLQNFSYEEKQKKSDLSKKINILFLARMEKEKGVFELIDAFNKLKEEFSQIELTLAGNGTNFKEISSYISGMSNIKLLGHIEGEAKAKAFKEADIYALPSYSEGLPVSVLEAMAFGLPIVTTSVGGLKYFFKEEMGYTTIPKEREDLQEKLKQLIKNQTDINKIGQFNFDYAQKNLMSDKISKRLHTYLVEA